MPSFELRDWSPQVGDQVVENIPDKEMESRQSPRPVPTVVSSEDGMDVQSVGHESVPNVSQELLSGENDQAIRTSGLLSSSDPWDSNLYMSNVFDLSVSSNISDLTSFILADCPQLHTSLHDPDEQQPTLSTSEANGGTSLIPSSTRQPNVAGVQFLKNGLPSGQLPALLPGLLLKKDSRESRYQGLNSIGATLSSCLIYAKNHSPDLGEHSLLQFLIQGISYMDEANICVAPTLHRQDLPIRSFVEHGVGLYWKNIHPRYPIISVELHHSWAQWYDHDGCFSSADPIQFLCVCMMAIIGATSYPTGPTDEMQEMISTLQRRAWSMMDYLLDHPYTGSVQVILLHTIYFTQQGKLGIAWSTCGIALRMAQAIGLHRHTPSDLQLSDEIVRLRARIWWVAYSLDAFLSLCEGRPTGTSSDQADAKIEPLKAQECPDCESTLGSMIYVWHVTLACLVNQIAGILNHERSPNERLHCLAELDIKIIAWHDAIPLEFRPGQEIVASMQSRHHVAWLHVQFFHVSRTLHWTSMLLAPKRNKTFPDDQYPRLRSSEAICVASARSLIRISNNSSVVSDTGELRLLGIPSAYFLAATSIIFMHILKEPQHLSATADVEYLRAGIHHLTSEFFATQVGQGQKMLMQMLLIAETMTKPFRSVNSTSNI